MVRISGRNIFPINIKQNHQTMRLENDIYLHSKNKKKVYQKLKEGGGGGVVGEGMERRRGKKE